MNGTRQPQQRVDGVLLLDKPQGITSNDALMFHCRPICLS